MKIRFIVYADDLGFGDLSCYGSHQISTPDNNGICKKIMLYYK